MPAPDAGPNMAMTRDTAKTSLLALAYRRAAMVLAAMVLSLGVNLWVIHQHIHQINTDQGQRALNQHAQNISQQLQFYRDVLKQLGRQSEVRDILVIQDAAAAQGWAERQRHYLPHNIGLALVGPDGRVLGTPVELRLGPSCVADLHKKLAHQPLAEPLVHRDNPRLAHFDLTELVTDSLGEALGTLFVSFSLDSLQALLTQSVLPREVLTLRNEQGETIARAGSAPEGYEILRHETMIPGSAWRLELIHAETNTIPVYLALGGTNLATSALIVAAFVTITVVMVRLFMTEFGRIKSLLDQIHAGESITIADSPLKETEQILPVIQAIAQDIQEKQVRLTALSLTDELTQMPNRRRFNMELERACNLSQCGVQVGLLLIDVDRFKQINDAAGHAAGDRVLQLLAACLQRDTRKTDFSARLGGDEFAVIVTNMQKSRLPAWTERLRADFRAAIEGDPLTAVHPGCTLSIGAAFAECTATRDPAELFRRADQALYRAKGKGRDCLEIDQTKESGTPN